MTQKMQTDEEREWERAFALRAALAPFIQTGFNTRGALRDFCRDQRCSKSTAYRWLARARTDDRASVLRRSKPGRKPMSIMLSERHEQVIRQVLRNEFLVRNGSSVGGVLKSINAELEGRGLHKVSRSTVQRRIDVIQDRYLKRKRAGSTAARQAFQIIRGRYEVKDALAVVQIDHTLLDIIVVDQMSKDPIGRPYLTVLLDLATRMPTGIYLSMDAPSAVNLMMAFQRAVFRKDNYLRQMGIALEWPAHGLPRVISSDNGSDLKSKAFNRGLAHYGVEHVFRPIAQPHLGGHVERFIGTIQKFVQTLPGTTFSNVQAKGTYQPQKHAQLTLLQLEKLILNFILQDQIHGDKRRLQTTQMNAWNMNWHEQGLSPRLPQNPERFRIDFLPFKVRHIQREGLEVFGMFYRSEHLQKMKNCGVQKVTVKYDPTDIRTVHISADDQVFYDAKAEHYPRYPLALYEWKELMKRRKERLNQNLQTPDPTTAHNFKKQILAEAAKQRRPRKTPPDRWLSSGVDIRNLHRRTNTFKGGGGQ